MKKYIPAFLLFLLCAVLLAVSCEPAAKAGENYDAWYIDQNIAQVDIETFAKMVSACDGIEKTDLAVTYTRYHKPLGGSKTQVIGLGFSYSAGDKLAQCYQDLIIAMGGVEF